jgi:putative restriction endonuclease
MTSNLDQLIRLKAFELLKHLKLIHGDNIPRKLLEQGFVYEGQRVHLIGQQGIFKPKILEKIPLSITTAPIVEGRPRPYDDSTADGLISYKYRGTNPNHHENVGLRKAMVQKTPLIHFHGVVPGVYAAVWPVYIVRDNPTTLTFTVAVDLPEQIYVDPEKEPPVEMETRRRYQTVETQIRLHQAGFRYKVLKAYDGSCAICHLKQPKLLEAAHILPDGHPHGLPVVQNGISLCMIHHGAYDSNIVGITPDFKIEINEVVLEEKDGPMLLHGLQEFHAKKLILPLAKRDWPKPEFLEERYQEFKAG